MQAQAAGLLSPSECGGKLSTSPESSIKSNKPRSVSVRQKSRINTEKKLSRQSRQHHNSKKATSRVLQGEELGLLSDIDNDAPYSPHSDNYGSTSDLESSNTFSDQEKQVRSKEKEKTPCTEPKVRTDEETSLVQPNFARIDEDTHAQLDVTRHNDTAEQTHAQAHAAGDALDQVFAQERQEDAGDHHDIEHVDDEEIEDQSCISKCSKKQSILSRIVCSAMMAVLLISMVISLALMILCLIVILKTNEPSHNNIWLSMSEVYKLNTLRQNHDMPLYTKEVCIEQQDKLLENTTLYIESGSCSDISTTTQNRTIEHSFSLSSSFRRLDFFWIKNTTFYFNLSITTTPETPENNITIYVFKYDNSYNASEYCLSNEPPYKPIDTLVFPYPASDNITCNISCTNSTNLYMTCVSEPVPINGTGRYGICKISQNDTYTNVSYTLNINEVRYVNDTEFYVQNCRLHKEQCCLSFDDILKEASDPTCMLLNTIESDDNDDAYSLGSFTVILYEKWDGLVYSSCMFITFIVVFIPVLCVFSYTCYRRRHPQGHCLIVTVNGVKCIC